jgi:hypothetical protein
MRGCGEEGFFGSEGQSAGTQGRLCSVSYAFHRFGCRKLSITMGLGAGQTRIQFARFSNGRATGGARHSQNLLCGEIFGLHHRMMQRSASGRCSILLTFDAAAAADGHGAGRFWVLANCEQK